MGPVIEKEDKITRGLIRSRSFLAGQLADFKREVLSVCRKHGLDYKGETGSQSLWTAKHKAWLNGKAEEMGGIARLNIDLLTSQLEGLSQGISSYNERIGQLSRSERYRKSCDILCCFQGLDRLSAMTLAVEIADIRRFSHPRKLSAYAGFDVMEHSSGGRENKFGISRRGNKAIRKVIMEACQQLGFPLEARAGYKEARQGMPKEVVDIAGKCSRRLREHYLHLTQRGKPASMAKTACAREMPGFIWAALRAGG